MKFTILTRMAYAALLAAICSDGIAQAASSRAAVNGAPVQVAPVQGRMMGGQQPVAFMTVQLYQAGTTGYGSASTPLGPSFMTTAKGNFTFPSYTCASGSQVYLVGTGGQPIAASGGMPAVTNPNLAIMVGLGTCGGAYLNGYIDVNELTTVATVWALAPFMTGIANVGSDAANALGLQNAFAAINEIVTTANGTISGPTLPAGAVLPTANINTLADLLAQCVNSSGGTAGDGSGCGSLFSLAPDASGTVYPTDTITAALNIAHNPGRNVAALNNLRTQPPVFTPVLNASSPPNDWTIGIVYSGGGLSAPTAVATDAVGSVWVTNGGNASVTKLAASGTAISTSTGFTAGGFSAPAAIAIDANGNAWVANAGNNTVTMLSASGTTGAVYSNNGLDLPQSIAIDGSGNVWVANSGSSGPGALSAFTASGTPVSGSPFSGGGAAAPGSVAVTPK